MRTVMFLKNNPNVVEDALERNPHHLLTARKSRCTKKKKRAREISLSLSLFFSSIIVLNICDFYLHLPHVSEKYEDEE